MLNWKTPLLKIGVVALGVGIGAGLVALGALIYLATPTSQKAWNAKAITATYESSSFASKPTPAGYFTYTLENNTKKDFIVKLLDESRLPSNLRAAALRGRLSRDGSLLSKQTPSWFSVD